MKPLTLAVVLWLVCAPTAKATPVEDDVVTLHGKVLDKKSQAPIEAHVTIYLNNDFVPNYSHEEYKGEFTAALDKYGMYIISITAPGFLETTDTVWVMNQNRKLIEKTFLIAPIEVGLTVTLDNIYFEFGNATLSERSFPELEKVVRFFRENPGTTFEIGGHTDANGPEDYNLYLSQARAQAVVNYLIEHGVEKTQLKAKGYGESRLINPAHSAVADAMNRRVEFTVLHTLAAENR